MGDDTFAKLADEGPVGADKLLKDNEILDESDMKKPSEPEKTEKTAKPKKPCANCTCGLADELNKQEATAAAANKSSCGSCHLGDAFRCASCPHRGMPAFKPGERVVIDTSDDI